MDRQLVAINKSLYFFGFLVVLHSFPLVVKPTCADAETLPDRAKNANEHLFAPSRSKNVRVYGIGSNDIGSSGVGSYGIGSASLKF